MNAKHIMLVEDEPQIRNGLTYFLSDEGFKVTALEDGKKAYEKALEIYGAGGRIDLLITDIEMPLFKGTELLAVLSKHNIRLPTIGISGYFDTRMIDELIEKGCVEFVYKPFKPENLVRSIKNYFDRQEKSGC